MRPRSTLIRTLYAFTALVTVWCLGCDAFDPLLSSLAQSGTTFMECASEGGAVTATHIEQEASVRDASPDDDELGAACDCQSCLAPAPAALVAAHVIPPLPDEPARSFSAPTSVEREPLVPPPQPVA